MSAEMKKGYGSTFVMMILGVLALYGGAGWLVVLVPVAVLVWYASTRNALSKSRN
jgi:hypothetical protein